MPKLPFFFLLIISSTALRASFSGPKQVIVGGSPNAVAIADLNGDGIPDIVSANLTHRNSQGSVSVVLGTGNGSFGTASMTPVYGEAYALAVADFNRDGKLDVVVLTDEGLFVLLGKGDGTFQPEVPITGGGELLQALGVADFNGDGIPDIAVDLYKNSVDEVQIFLGNGDGTFRAFASLPCSSFAPLAIADFNHDGKFDIAAVCNGAGTSGYPAVVVFLGNGDGTFAEGQNLFVSSYGQYGVAVGDFNKDGKPDLAILEQGIAIFSGNGDGTFTRTGATTVSGSGPPVVGDFNGDGYPDIATPDGTGGTVVVSLNNGHGAFPTYSAFSAGNALTLAAVADLNQDGKADIAVASSGSNSVDVLFGNGHGSFDSPRAFTAVLPSGDPPDNNSPLVLATADFNKDGNLDIATSFGEVLLGNGKNSYRGISAVAQSGAGGSVLAVDINNDGNADVIVGGSLLSVALGRGNGSFAPSLTTTPLNGGFIAWMAAGDFNGDGKLDVIAVSAGVFATVEGAYLLLGNGDGTFQTPIALSTQTLTGVAAADFNGDGRLDVVLLNPGNSSLASVIILLGNGDGTFQPPVNLNVQQGFSYYFRGLCVADLNGDGIPDIVLSGSTTLGNLPRPSAHSHPRGSRGLCVAGHGRRDLCDTRGI